MKTNFKKILSCLLVCVMLVSVFSVSVSAAGIKITLAGGYRTAGKVTGDFNAKYDAFVGTAKTTTARDVFAYSSTGGATTLAIGVTYYEFTKTIDGVEYSFRYTIDEKTNEKKNESVVFETDDSGNFVYPEYFFDIPGYSDQDGWGTNRTGNTNKKVTGDSATVSRAYTYYACYPTQEKYAITYEPGALGTGAVVSDGNKTYGSKVTLKGAIFTRDDYTMIGWATTENATVADYELSQKNVEIKGNFTLYPVWKEVVYNVVSDTTSMNFGSICVDYSVVEAQTLKITNNSNTAVTLKPFTNSSFNITPSSTQIAVGSTITVKIQPKTGLQAGTYSTDILFDFGTPKANFSVSVKFIVKAHMFIRYFYNNDATYLSNGTETATCHSGCGAVDTRVAVGTQKVFSVDNNKADGILKEYIQHKTVNFVAYGSGMDYTQSEIDFAVANGLEVKRFRPVSWYVNDDFNGEFTPETTDYTVKYVHSDYGKFKLEINYVEEQYVDGEWVATGVEDVKSYNYSIGPSADDVQNVEMPKTIVSIIFALMAYLVDAVSGLLK